MFTLKNSAQREQLPAWMITPRVREMRAKRAERNARIMAIVYALIIIAAFCAAGYGDTQMIAEGLI